MMIKIICSIALFFLTQSSLVLSEENQITHCEQITRSFIAIGLQLKHSPNLTQEDLNDIANKHTDNLKLREFLKHEIVPQLLNKNPEMINSFISTNNIAVRCSLISK